MITNLADFYRSDAWERLIRILAAERLDENGNIICAHCGRPIIRKYDRIAHHVVPLTLGNVNDVQIALNPENIVFVHHRCHNEIHERFGFGHPNIRQPKKVYLVYGSPCAGKTTFVHDNAAAGDLLVDMDSIWCCINAQGKGGHEAHENALKRCAFGVRDCLLDMVKTRTGNWRNAYIVGGYPLIAERERMRTIYGAELVHVDTARDVCELRAKERPKEWLDYIGSYWERYQAGSDEM